MHAHARLQRRRRPAAGGGREAALNFGHQLGGLHAVEARRLARLVDQPIRGEVPAHVFGLARHALEPREDRVRVRAVHVSHRAEVELDVELGDELGDLVRGVKLLPAELLAGEAYLPAAQ